MPHAICEAEFDSTTTLCGPLPVTFTFAAFDAVVVHGPVVVVPPLATVDPPEPVRPPVAAELPPVVALAPAADPPVPVRPPAAVGTPPVAWEALVPPTARVPPVAFAPPDAVETLLLLVPPAGGFVEAPATVAPLAPAGLPPVALATPVAPPTPGDPDSEVLQPTAVKVRPSSANIERGSFFIVDLQVLIAAVAAVSEFRFKKEWSREIAGSFVVGPPGVMCMTAGKFLSKAKVGRPAVIDTKGMGWLCTLFPAPLRV